MQQRTFFTLYYWFACVIILLLFFGYHESIHGLICTNIDGLESTYSFSIWPFGVRHHCGDDLHVSLEARKLHSMNEIVSYPLLIVLIGIMFIAYIVTMQLGTEVH